MPDLLNLQGEFEADSWVSLADDESLPEAPAKLLVSLERWQQQEAELLASKHEVGVRLDNTLEIEAIGDLINGRPVIALNFPAFTDGRAYSQARVLRERCGYKGQIRACGDVLNDQLFYMARCGFDCFEAPANLERDKAQAALHTFSVAYQPTAASAAIRYAGPAA